MAEYSDDELNGKSPTPGSFPVTNFGPRREFNDEELAPGYVSPENRGVLSNSPDDGWISSALKSAGTIGIDAAAGTAGMLGEALNMGNVLGAKAASVIDPSRTMGERLKDSEDQRAKSRAEGNYWDAASWIPTMSDVKSFITPYTGEYKPTSGAGRAAQTGLGAAAMALTPGGAERNVSLGTKVLEEGLPALIGGSTAQIVGEQTEDPFLAMVSGLGTSLLGRTGVVAGRNWANPDAAAKAVAGHTLRENATDPAAARARLDGYDPSTLLPGMPVRSGIVSGDPGLMSLDVLLGQDGRFKGRDTAAADAANAVAGDAATANTVVRQGAEDAANSVRPNISSTYGISGTSPRQSASESVRSIYTKLEEDASKRAEDAWKDPRIENAMMFKNKVIDKIDSYFNGLSAARKQLIPQNVMDLIDTIRNSDGKTIPLTEIQDLRSRVLGEGRKQFRAGDNFAGGQNNNFGAHLADILSDGSNIQFGDKPRVLPGAPAGSPVGTARDAWQNAVDLTRDYHQKFNEGFLKDLNEYTPGGLPSVALGKTLDEAFKPSYGTQALEQLQKVTNGQVNGPAADYMIAKLTNDGSKIVKPQDVDRWLSQGNNAAIVDKIPGLRQRIEGIKGASAVDQMANAFDMASSNPEKLVGLFDTHRSLIAKLPPQQQQYFQMLENSAKMASTKIPKTPAGVRGALESLANGNTSDLLYAVGSGRLASIFAGVTATMMAGHVLPDSITALLPESLLGETALGAALGAGHIGPVSMKRPVEGLLTGHVRQRALDLLQAARNDPKLMAELLGKPSPEKLKHLLSPAGVVGIGAAAEQGVDEGRNGFATGGAVNEYDQEANRLIGETDKAREFLSKQTESILNKPDDHVVAALNAVKNVI